MSNMQSCNNCLKEFKTEQGYQYHIKEVKCNKVEFNPDGTLKKSLDNQCKYCFKVLSNNNNYKVHMGTCKKMKSIIKNTSTITGNQNQSIIVNGDNNNTSNISISMPTFYVLKPAEPFNRVVDNYITIYNIYSLLNHSIDNATDNFNEYIEDFCKIIKNIYLKGINIFDRNLWSVSNNKDFDVHYYKDDNWKIDDNCNNLIKNIITVLLSQTNESCKVIIRVLRNLIEYNMDELQKYIDVYGTLTDIIIKETTSMFYLNKHVSNMVSLYNKFRGKYPNSTNSKIMHLMKIESALPQTSLDNYSNIIGRYQSLVNFVSKENAKGLLARRVKELIEYDAKKNDTLINDFVKYNPQ